MSSPRSLTGLRVLLGAIALCSAADAAVVTTTASQTGSPSNSSPNYTVSSTDLLNGLLPSSQVGDFTKEGTGGTPVLTNGTVANPVTRDGDGAFQFSTFATGGNTGGTRVEYTLPQNANVNVIDVFGGWQDGGRDQQNYTISYSESVGGLFRTLGTVNFNPTDPAGHPQTTKVTWTDNTGLLAHNAKVIRFDFNATENGYSGYDEIDVSGRDVAQVLANPGFESPVVGTGNNIGTTPTGWSVNTGNPGSFNLIGSAGGGESGSNQFLDLTASGTFVFQSFTLNRSEIVDFGAYFSPRDGGTGGGSTAIYDSTNTTLLASSPYVSATGTNSPWVLSQNAASILLGPGTYIFRAIIDDGANVDSAFVTIPEPSSLALAGLGLVVLFGVRRRGEAGTRA